MRFRMTGPSLVVDTPAKLNLHLEVLGRRADGFHQLETVMVSIGLYDTLTLTPADERIELDCHSGSVTRPEPLPPADDHNLILRAADRLQERTGCRSGARISLTKRIPMEAGLGGGSSDAAAALVGLNRLWGLGLSGHDLHEEAARLGSDVNFFLDSPRLAICRGRGEEIVPRPLRGPLWFVVVKPPGGLSTAAVFRELSLGSGDRRSCAAIVDAAADGNAAHCGRQVFNALESPARQLSVEVREVLRQLRSERLPGVALSGSGTACFGVCRNRSEARRAASRLRATGTSDVFVVQAAI